MLAYLVAEVKLEELHDPSHVSPVGYLDVLDHAFEVPGPLLFQKVGGGRALLSLEPIEDSRLLRGQFEAAGVLVESGAGGGGGRHEIFTIAVQDDVSCLLLASSMLYVVRQR